MTRSFSVRLKVLAWLGLLLAVPLIAACARLAPAPAPSPAPATKPAPAPAPATRTSPLSQIIEGAKKEGQLSVILSPAHTSEEAIKRMRTDIKEKYGVDLDIKVTANTDQTGQTGIAIMEYKTGTVPTFDAMTLGSDVIALGQREGIWEMVDWKPLLQQGTPPEVIPQYHELASGLIPWSGMTGLSYNARKVTASEVPKTLADLGDSKWKGRIGIFGIASYYTRWGFLFGKEKTQTELRAIMKNTPFVEQMPRLNTRFLIGEVDVQLNTSAYVKGNREKGVPSQWQSLDFVDSRDFQISVRKGARHPNAARLFAIYIASPDGIRVSVDLLGQGNRHYPGNIVYDVAQPAQKKGVLYTFDNTPKMLEFVLSDDYARVEKEFDLILKGQ